MEKVEKEEQAWKVLIKKIAKLLISVIDLIKVLTKR